LGAGARRGGDVATGGDLAAGVSGAMVGGAIAVSAALGRDVLHDLPLR
jgi:hypothetical protein